MEIKKEYEIWVGNYTLGQGYSDPGAPELVGKILAPNFKVACVVHELRTSLRGIEKSINDGVYVDHQSCRWFYDFDKNENSWTGKYFETKEEAEATF